MLQKLLKSIRVFREHLNEQLPELVTSLLVVDGSRPQRTGIPAGPRGGAKGGAVMNSGRLFLCGTSR